MSEEHAIREFLQGRPTSQELRQWRETLEQRVRALRAEMAQAEPEAREALARRLAQLKKGIAGLREEEEITRFVEDSVRVTLAMGAAADLSGEDLE
ncbi:MAG: hypothetical protein HY320_01040 [Armatimonadetes bacterium]|nr:hypothetical protein [Armatimonadota bacterium]